LHEITIPEREMHVYTIQYIGIETVSAQELKKRIFAKINSFPEVTDPKKALGKDFRRTEIRARWNELIPDSSTETYGIARARAIVSSGTYIRSLSAHLGTTLGTTSLAFSIHRTRMGRFLPFLGTGVWLHTYRS
jgi:tRNA U55 pseudouridine synthase TruB